MHVPQHLPKEDLTDLTESHDYFDSYTNTTVYHNKKPDHSSCHRSRVMADVHNKDIIHR